MSGVLKRYPAMKDSGVPWLGHVPEHWELRRLHSLLSRNNSGVWGEDFDDDGVIVLRSTEQTVNGEWKISAPARRRLTPSEYASSRLQEGDLVVTKSSGSILHIGKTSIVTRDVEALDCCFSNFMQRLRVKQEMIPRFLWYTLNGELGREQFNFFSDTTTGLANLNAKIINNVGVTCPPIPEQHAIVRFLDPADRRIRRYIRAKERLIELLEEQKQAVVHQAVTGQIDVRTGRPYPAYKDSGIDWLGKVPEHWAVSRLGRLICLTVGFPFQSEGFTQFAGDVRLLRGVNVAPGELRWDEVARWPKIDADRFAEYQMAVGDIVLGMDRPIIRGGVRLAIVSQSGVPSLLLQRVARIRPSEGLIRDFAFALLSGNSFLDYLAPIFTGVSVPHLSPEQIRAFSIALPSVVEQEAIVEYLRSRISDIRSAIYSGLKQIELVREYRTRLIADVVTGKLDVREAAAAMPEELDAPTDAMETIELEDATERQEEVVL